MNVAPPPAQTVGQALVSSLADLGVRHAFGVSGGGIAAIWAPLSASRVRVGHVRHESGAVFAAIEANLATGEPVVVFTTTGPGLINAMTGLLAARDEGASIILLSACTAPAQRGRRAIQETGSDALSPNLAHMSVTIETPEGLPHILRCLAAGLRHPGGFVGHLALPTSLQSARASPRTIPYSSASLALAATPRSSPICRAIGPTECSCSGAGSASPPCSGTRPSCPSTASSMSTSTRRCPAWPTRKLRLSRSRLRSAVSSRAEHASFGMGRHLCLGAAMAKIEVAVAVNRLLDAMPALRFVDREAPLDHGLFLRGPARLALRFEPDRQLAPAERGYPC